MLGILVDEHLVFFGDQHQFPVRGKLDAEETLFSFSSDDIAAARYCVVEEEAIMHGTSSINKNH